MTRSLSIVILFSLFFLEACSSRQLYDSIQASERHKCLQLPASQQDECFAMADKPYHKVEQERQEVLDAE